MGRCRIKTVVAIAAAIAAASSSICLAQTSGSHTAEAMDTAAPSKAPSVAVKGALTQFLGASEPDPKVVSPK